MSPLKVFAASVVLLTSWAFNAHAGVAVVIDRSALKLVGASASECPPSKVIFVTREGRIAAVCEAPPPKPMAAAGAAGEGGERALIPKAPTPVWRIAEKASIREALAKWLPADWRLAWDTTTEPTAQVAFSFEGEPMAAVADLFDRRSVWGDAPLLACLYPKDRVLQVRATGECGSP